VADVTLNVAGQTIAATFVEARAEAQCADGHAFVRGDADVARLVINGQEIGVSGDIINQRLDLPGGGFVVVNEQVAETNNNNGDITVRALHIVIPGLLPGMDTDVIIAEAHADIRCGQRFCPQDKDFVTGGGWLGSPRRNFAVAGGIRRGEFWGHLLYINHGEGIRAKGTDVTAYEVTGPTSRRIRGTCEINGNPGTYDVHINDVDEPGRGADTFEITFSSGETATGVLSGGNIQLHTCK
jgi:hypothetical protein